jgi:hypothetical protein
MKKPVKIFLWLIGILAGIIALFSIAIMAFSFYLMGDMSDSIEDLRTFSENASKIDCINEMARRLEACGNDDLTCNLKPIIFAVSCTEMTKDKDTELCQIYNEKRWQAQFCTPHKLNYAACDSIHEVLLERCGNNEKQPDADP